MITIRCPNCGNEFRVPPSIVGKKVRCKNVTCLTVFPAVETSDEVEAAEDDIDIVFDQGPHWEPVPLPGQAPSFKPAAATRRPPEPPPFVPPPPPLPNSSYSSPPPFSSAPVPPPTRVQEPPFDSADATDTASDVEPQRPAGFLASAYDALFAPMFGNPDAHRGNYPNLARYLSWIRSIIRISFGLDLVGASLLLIGALYQMFVLRDDRVHPWDIVVLVAWVIGSYLFYVISMAILEFVHVIMDIEANTRRLVAERARER